MGWFNPDVSWNELERQMSGRSARDRTVNNPEADSAPGYPHKRPAYASAATPVSPPEGPTVPYAELHCHSNFSFLDGVNDPEELVEEAVRLGLDALAVTDHDGFYAASRFAEAAAAYKSLRTVYGCRRRSPRPSCAVTRRAARSTTSTSWPSAPRATGWS